MTPPVDREIELATTLATAREGGLQIRPTTHLTPTDLDSAYRVQHTMLARAGQAIAGWKVGAKSTDGPIQGAPLPAAAVLPSPASVRRAAHPVLGLELELAFRFGRRFEPSQRPYESRDVLDAIVGVAAAIEVVSSRLCEWPNVDKLLQLADLQNHGALAVGAVIDYTADFPFVAPSMRFRFEGKDVFKGKPGNPAGDPRRLLAWVVNHCTARGLSITPETVVTTGSYSGMFFPQGSGVAVGEIDGLPPVQLTLI